MKLLQKASAWLDASPNKSMRTGRSRYPRKQAVGQRPKRVGHRSKSFSLPPGSPQISTRPCGVLPYPYKGGCTMTMNEMGAPGPKPLPGPLPTPGRFEGVRFAPRRPRPCGSGGRSCWPPTPWTSRRAREARHVPGFAGPPVFDREARIQDMAAAVEEVAKSADPVGKTPLRPEGSPTACSWRRSRCPWGLSPSSTRPGPNVTSDAAALCLKAGNAVILRGGKEAVPLQPRRWSRCCGRPWRKGGLPADCVQLVEDTSRQSRPRADGP